MTNTQNTATPSTYAHVGAGAIKFLRSPLATLIVLCSALLAQLPHAADVFRMIVAGNGWPAILHGFTYAVALELAVLLFVVQHRNVESYIFAGVSILVNLSYYYLHGVALLSVQALPAWLVSIALPAAIAQYSHLIVAATEHGEAQPAAAPATASRRRWQFWKKPAESLATSNATTDAPIVESDASCGHSEGADAITVQPPTPAESPKQGKTARKANEYGMTDAQLAALLGVSRQRIAPMRSNGTLTTRVARELPQLEPVHSNGYSHE